MRIQDIRHDVIGVTQRGFVRFMLIIALWLSTAAAAATEAAPAVPKHVANLTGLQGLSPKTYGNIRYS